MERQLSIGELLGFTAAVAWVVGVWAFWARLPGLEGIRWEPTVLLFPCMFTVALLVATLAFLVGGRRGFSRIMEVIFVAGLLFACVIFPWLLWWIGFGRLF